MYYIVKSFGGHLLYVNEKHSLSRYVTDALEFQTEEAAKEYFEDQLAHQDINFAVINAEEFANSFVIAYNNLDEKLYLEDFDVQNIAFTSWTRNIQDAAVFLPDQKKFFDYVKDNYPKVYPIWKTKILF
jgi:hypothetical protein